MGATSASDRPLRDIVVLGGSAGCLTHVQEIVRLLPRDIPAALFLVVHVAASGNSRLAAILAGQGTIAVGTAAEGDEILPGRLLVAPPGRHLLLDVDGVHLTQGPRERSARPSVDVLFRSAAQAFGARVAGVILSGYLDDGAAGLEAIVRAGGVGIVQQPGEAAVPNMPQNAIARAQPHLVEPAAGIARWLVLLARGIRPELSSAGLTGPSAPP